MVDKTDSVTVLAAEVLRLGSTEVRWRALCRIAAPRLAAFVQEVDRLTAEMMDDADRDGEPEARCAVGEVRRRLGLEQP